MSSPDVPAIDFDCDIVNVLEPVTFDQPPPKVYVPELATLPIDIDEIVPLPKPLLPTEN